MSKRKSDLVRHRFPVKDNVYNRAITLLYGSVDDINEVLEADTPVSEKFVPLEPSSAAHWRVIEEDGHEADYICIVHKGKWIDELAALSHEALHHVCHAFRSARLPLTEDSEEAYTYYLGWIVTQCLAVLQKHAD